MPRRIAPLAALTTCVVLATGVLVAPAPAYQQLENMRLLDLPEGERELAWRVSEPRMVAVVRQLVALGPRMGGTRSNDASAAWLSKQFEYAGLEVRVRDDAPQRFHEEDGWEVAVVGGDTLEAAWPQGGSPSAYGTGRLSVTPGPGLVCLTSERPRPDATEGCLAVLSDGRAGASGWPQVGGLRGEWTIPVFGISKEEGEMLRALVAEEPATEVRVELVSRTGEARPKTVIATIPGVDRSRNLLFSPRRLGRGWPWGRRQRLRRRRRVGDRPSVVRGDPDGPAGDTSLRCSLCRLGVGDLVDARLRCRAP